MARKKIVFVIVEGPSDDDAIGYFLDKRGILLTPKVI